MLIEDSNDKIIKVVDNQYVVKSNDNDVLVEVTDDNYIVNEKTDEISVEVESKELVVVDNEEEELVKVFVVSGEKGEKGEKGDPGKDGSSTWGTITGDIDNQSDLSQKFRTIQDAIQELSIKITNIYFDTKMNWDMKTSLVSEKNAIYVYIDNNTDSYGNLLASFKIGDGKAFVVDLPFTDSGIYEHINNTDIHITNVTGTVSCTGSAVLATNSSYAVSVTCSGSNLLKSGTRFGTNGKNLTGTYAANTYTVSYNANGHGTAPAAQTKTAGTTLTLQPFIATNYSSEYTVTITGNKGTGDAWSGSNGSAKWRYTYTQTYWNTNSSGTGTNYGSKGSYTANAGATLYAIWKSTSAGTSYTLPTGTPTKNATTSSSMTVTFNPNKGQTTKGSQTSVKTTTYSFKGWFTASSGGTQRTTSSRVTAAETVYAQFNSSTGAQAAVTLPTTAQCTRLGYTLLGFSTSSTATTATYNPGASYTPSATITLYAVWSKNNYTLTFDANGGECSETSRTVAYNTNIDDLPVPTRSGYKFVGWGHDFNGSQQATWGRDMMYTNQISIHLSAYMDDWNLYGSTPMRMISCTEGAGWNIEPSASGSSYKFNFLFWDAGASGYKSTLSSTLMSELDPGWHTFDMIFDGTNVKGYIDGILEGTSANFSGAIGYHSTNGIFLGCEAIASETTGGAPYFTGSIANITIRNNTTLLPDDTYTSITSPAGNWALKAYWVESANYIKLYTSSGWQDIELQTYIGSSRLTDLTGTTWYMNDEIDAFITGSSQVQITGTIGSDNIGNDGIGIEEGFIYNWTGSEVWFEDEWNDPSYRNWTITNGTDTTRTTFIDWMYENGTLVSPSSFVKYPVKVYTNNGWQIVG